MKILHLEDDPLATETAQLQLNREGLQAEFHRVDTMAAFQQALESGDYDLILSDYTIPGVDSLDALRWAVRHAPPVPFIFLSGTIPEEQAIEALKVGASDYVLKHRLGRLGPAVRRALRQGEERSHRREAEAALRESERRYRTLFESIDEGFCIVEIRFDENQKPVDYRFLETNPAFEKQSGLAGVQGKWMREIVPEHEEFWFETYGHVALTGQPARFQSRSQFFRRWYDVFAFRFGEPEQNQVAIVFNDITDRKEAQQALREQAHFAQLRADATEALQRPGSLRDLLQRLASLLVERLEATFVRVWTLDSTRKVLELQASAGLYTHLDGAHARVPVGHLKIGRIAAQRQPLVTNQVLGDPHIAEQEWARRENLVAFAGFPLISEGEQLLGVIALFARHTLSLAAQEAFGAVAGILAQTLARKQAETALRESKERALLAVETAALGTYERDLITNQVTVNAVCREIIGVTQEHPPPEVIRNAVLPEDANRIYAAVARAFDPELREVCAGEFRVLRPDGSVRWVAGRGRVLFDESSDPPRAVKFVGILFDVTERREFQAQLERVVAQRTAKLHELVAELEHFSYTITHDMRAPLRAMRGFAEMLAEAGEQASISEREVLLRKIIAAAERMDLLITDALSYSRAVRHELALEPVDLDDLLRGMLDTYPELQPSRAEIWIDGVLPTVIGNEAGLTQCFSNLLGNSVKFVEQGKKPEIRVWAETVSDPKWRGVAAERSPPESHLPQKDRPAEWVRIWVEDHGIGIPPAVLPRVFEMFTRGQSSYAGTGIGLALVRKVVERMGGRVGVESEPQRGSRFWVELQRAQR